MPNLLDIGGQTFRSVADPNRLVFALDSTSDTDLWCDIDLVCRRIDSIQRKGTSPLPYTDSQIQMLYTDIIMKPMGVASVRKEMAISLS